MEVADTGIVISVESLVHIFERFYKADRARTGGGSGLGLVLVKKIVDMRGGAIAAKSAPGLGSRFSVRLPRIDG